MRRIRGKRSASSIVGCAPRCAEPHAETPEGVLPQAFRGGRPVSKTITSFVGLDVHKDSTAIAAAEAGRETPRFIGTVGPQLAELLKGLTISHQGPCPAHPLGHRWRRRHDRRHGDHCLWRWARIRVKRCILHTEMSPLAGAFGGPVRQTDSQLNSYREGLFV
jgi:hypothetical protein